MQGAGSQKYRSVLTVREDFFGWQRCPEGVRRRRTVGLRSSF